MKKVIIFIAVFILIAGALFTQEVIELAPQEEEKVTAPEKEENIEKPREIISVKTSTFNDIENLWMEAIDQIERKQWDYALDNIRKIKQIKNEVGTIVIAELSNPLLLKCKTLLDKNEWTKAYDCFALAQEIDPTNMNAYIGLTHSSLRKGIDGAIISLYHLFSSVKGRMLTIFSAIQLIDDSVQKLYTIIFLLSIAFGVVFLIKYWSLFYHDLGEKYEGKFDGKTLRLLGMAIVIIPLFIFIGWGWIFLYWCLLFWGYADRVEKAITVIIVLFIIISAPLFTFLDQIKGVCFDDEIVAYHKAIYENLSPSTIKCLQQQSYSKSDNIWIKLLLAEQLKKRGDYPAAISTYNEILSKEPSNVKVLNNLANTYYSLDMAEDAVKYYEKAINANPNDATLFYNYSLAVRSQFNFSKADELLNRAQLLNLGLILEYESRPPEKKGIVDYTLKPSDLMMLIFQKIPAGKNYLNIAVLFLNPMTAILIIMIIMIRVKMKKFYYAKRCVTCGIPFCKRCQPVEKNQRYCSQCLHLFIKKDGVAQSVRKEKLDYIEKVKKKKVLMSYILNIIAPGSGSIYLNYFNTGLLALLIWSILVSMFFSFQWRIIPYFIKEFNLWLSLFFGVILILYYLIFNIFTIIRPRQVS